MRRDSSAGVIRVIALSVFLSFRISIESGLAIQLAGRRSPQRGGNHELRERDYH